MLAKTLFTLALAAIFAPLLVHAGGAMVALYSGLDCHDADYIQTVPVYDNSCMDWAKPGWSSYKLVAPGGWVMWITAYSKNNCWPMGMKGACADARFTNKCVNSHDEDGAANALSSMMWPECG